MTENTANRRPPAPAAQSDASARPFSTRDANAQRRRAAFTRLLDRQGLTPTDLARMVGSKTANALYNFINGRSEGFSLDMVERILSVLPTVTFDELAGWNFGEPATARSDLALVTLELCEGRWIGPEQVPPLVMAGLRLPRTSHGVWEPSFGAKVCRPGAEALYPAGTVLIWRPVQRLDEPVPAKARLIIRRERRGLLEFTVRERPGRGSRASPVTDLSSLMAPTAPGETDRLRLTGVVLATWWPEPGFPVLP